MRRACRLSPRLRKGTEMSTNPMGDPLLRFNEAMGFAEKIQDKGLKQFVLRALVLVFIRVTKGETPSTPMDMMYYAEPMVVFYGQRESLKLIFAGEDLSWWPDLS